MTAHINEKKARLVEDAMFTLYQEHGSMTDDDLIRAGFSREEIDTCAAKVAQRVRNLEQVAA